MNMPASIELPGIGRVAVVSGRQTPILVEIDFGDVPLIFHSPDDAEALALALLEQAGRARHAAGTGEPIDRLPPGAGPRQVQHFQVRHFQRSMHRGTLAYLTLRAAADRLAEDAAGRPGRLYRAGRADAERWWDAPEEQMPEAVRAGLDARAPAGFGREERS